ARGEYYNDANQVIIQTNTPNGLQTIGYSINLDYQILESAVWRLEMRGFNSKDAIFYSPNQPIQHNHWFTTALAISF
ncbi:MAG: porin, partial [Bacteroidia bacterium]|nr:porin [Bacteroidia bacterium]